MALRMEPDVQAMAVELARAKARMDWRDYGKFTNRYPEGTPEHEAYARFASERLRAIGRALRSLQLLPNPQP